MGLTEKALNDWRSVLKYDPVAPLLKTGNTAIEYFARRDLVEEPVDPIGSIWNLPEAQKIIKKQQANGSWKSTNKNRLRYTDVNYDLIETWRWFRFIIDQYEFDRSDQATEKAAEYVFSCQTEEGDIRGILANQYAMYYSGVILSLLIKAGYQEDPRVEKGMQWLLTFRQNDGGWLASPLMALDLPSKEVNRLTSCYAESIKVFDRSKPSSHNWTGMVIRAFAAHPKYRNSDAALTAANLLKSMFFREDRNYSSYKHADNWVRFQFPFWWNNLVSALDSISLIGISKDDEDIAKVVDWLIEHQEPEGLWNTSYSTIHRAGKGKRSRETALWISLAICRILKRFLK